MYSILLRVKHRNRWSTVLLHVRQGCIRRIFRDRFMVHFGAPRPSPASPSRRQYMYEPSLLDKPSSQGRIFRGWGTRRLENTGSTMVEAAPAWQERWVSMEEGRCSSGVRMASPTLPNGHNGTCPLLSRHCNPRSTGGVALPQHPWTNHPAASLDECTSRSCAPTTSARVVPSHPVDRCTARGADGRRWGARSRP
jgi:hypothetical protein